MIYHLITFSICILKKMLYNKDMKRLTIIIAIFAFFTLNIHSQSESDYLFINTSPIRAKVIIDGRETKLVTPCIIKEENIEQHEIVLRKSSFNDYTVTLEEIRTKSVDITLVPSSMDIYFPQRSSFKVGSTLVKGPVYIQNLPEGKYNFKFSNNRINFSRENPFLPVEASLGTALGISFASMITTIAISEYFTVESKNLSNNENDRYFYQTSANNMDYAKYATIGVTSALAVALVSVIIVDAVKRVKNKKETMEITNKIPSTQDDIFYETALQFMRSGEVERSTQILQSILSLYPDAELIPQVYYQLGQNYFITQDYDRAQNYWEIFIRDYPLAEYYDYVIKNIADIYYAKKDYKAARQMLNRVLFTDNILNKESLYSFRAKIDFEIYQTEKTKESFSLAELEYNQLIEDFPASERLDIYFLMLIKLYNSAGNADKIDELKGRLEELTNLDQPMRELIESYFE